MKFRPVLAVLCAVVTCAASATAAPERFQIDAQYRGMVSRAFPGIGSAVLDSTANGPGSFALTASGEATHPMEKSKRYQATVGMSVQVRDGRVAVTRSTEKSLPGSEQFAQQMRDVMPILAIARSHPAVAAGTLKTLQTPTGPVTLDTRRSGATVEITAARSGAFVAKIFLTQRGTALKLDRFRVPSPEENVMLNFVPTNALVSASVLD